MAQFKDLIEKNVIYKGEVQNVLSTNLVDITGNYDAESPYISALGGQILQIFYTLEEISTKYPHGLKNYMEKKIEGDDGDYFLRPNNPSELLLPEHLMPFLMHYLKDMKNDSIDILLHPICVQFLEQNNTELDDLSTLDDEQLIAFKELHTKQIMAKSHRDRGKMMDRLYDYLIDILAKKVPTDNVTVKIDQIHHKVKFVTMPDDVVEEDFEQKITEEAKEGEEQKEPQVIHRKKNINDVAVLLLKPGQVQEEEEVKLEIEHEMEEGDENNEEAKSRTQTVIKMVEQDQKDKALAIKGRDI